MVEMLLVLIMISSLAFAPFVRGGWILSRPFNSFSSNLPRIGDICNNGEQTRRYLVDFSTHYILKHCSDADSSETTVAVGASSRSLEELGVSLPQHEDRQIWYCFRTAVELGLNEQNEVDPTSSSISSEKGCQAPKAVVKVIAPKGGFQCTNLGDHHALCVLDHTAVLPRSTKNVQQSAYGRSLRFSTLLYLDEALYMHFCCSMLRAAHRG